MDGSSRSTQSGGPSNQSELACNICLRRTPNSPVAAYCGHVFCWLCLYRSRPLQGPEVQAGPAITAITMKCPVCRTALREGFNIVPIYGYDNVAAPRSGTERVRTTGTTTAAAAPDTATSPRPTAAAAAPVSNTAIPPRPTAASFFTTTPHRPYSVAARVASAARAATRARFASASASAARTAARSVARAGRAWAAAAPNTAITAAVPSDTDIPPRPNPARISQTLMDAAEILRDSASTFPSQGAMFGFGASDRLRPPSSAARNIGLGVALRSIRRRRNFRLNLRGMDGNGGIGSESHRARVERGLIEILEDIGVSLSQMTALFDAHDELEDALHRTI